MTGSSAVESAVSSSADSNVNSSANDVIVVGAGLAGLAAALTLARARRPVRALEADDRVGGRVLTVRAPFDDGLYAEAGGEFVDGGHALLHAFLGQYGLTLLPIPNGLRLARFGGVTRRGDALADFSPGSPGADRDEGRISRETALLAERISDPTQPWLSAPDLDEQSIGGWLDGLGIGTLARSFQQVWRTVDYGAEPQHLSLLQYARDERLWLRAPDLPSGRVRGGMDQLPLAMAAELGDRLTLGATVTAIRQDERGVRVTYQQAGQQHEVRGSAVVLAAPPPAVRRIVLDPPLPEPQRAAYAGLPMGRITKVLVQVRRRFWQDFGVNGRAFTDGLLQATYETTAGQPGERAVLTIYTGDQTSDRVAALTESERLAALTAELETLYPGCSSEIERAVTVAWDATSRPGGAYSHFRPGDLTRFGPWLARPFGRLHLAGEHTDPWQATMNGALASGQRAAREILAEG